MEVKSDRSLTIEFDADNKKRYFRCLANNEPPPVKDSLEWPLATQKTDSGLTLGIVKILHKQVTHLSMLLSSRPLCFPNFISMSFFCHVNVFQIAPIKAVELELIEEKWLAVNLPVEKFHLIVQLGNFSNENLDWIKFMAIACSTISKDLVETLTKVCQVLTADPPGANARIKFDVFKEIYEFLAVQVEQSTPKTHVDEVCAYLQSEWV